MKFKKHISIFLALFILFVNSSASFVVHYCHNNIAYISLAYENTNLAKANSEDTCCHLNDKTKEKSCCSNEEIKIEKKIDFSVLKSFEFNFLAVYLNNNFPDFLNEIVFFNKQKTLEYYCNSNAPPFYKLYSQLIFYA